MNHSNVFLTWHIRWFKIDLNILRNGGMEAWDCNPTVQETGSRELCKFRPAWVVRIRSHLNTTKTKHGGNNGRKRKKSRVAQGMVHWQSTWPCVGDALIWASAPHRQQQQQQTLNELPFSSFICLFSLVWNKVRLASNVFYGWAIAVCHILAFQ